MFRLMLVLALVATAYGYGRILGGEDVEIENFNYQLSLREYGRHKCGASLLGQSVAVTAAYCIYPYATYPEQFSVHAGSSVVSSGGQVRSVREIHQDGRYVFRNDDYNVAILILSQPLTLSAQVGLLKLPPRDFRIPVGTPGVVTGWGETSKGSGVSSKLQAVKVPHVDWNDCYRYYPSRFTLRMSCWGYRRGNKDVCEGDTGGPLVIYDKNGTPQLAGIVSRGRSCTSLLPGIYADVTNQQIYDFIVKYL